MTISDLCSGDLRLLGVGSANGTFGELLQGALLGPENHFLITLPIHRFSTVTYRLEPEHASLEVTPSHKTKTKRAAQFLLSSLGLPERGRLEIVSELPEGKGMASSSADLVATARAIYGALDRPIEEDVLLHSMRSIEPTDGVMYPEFVSFYHRRVQLHRRLGLLDQPLHILAVDEGGKVDTVAYNAACHGYTADECEVYEALLESAREAFTCSDLPQIGAIATRSATLHQTRNPKRHFAAMHEICRQVDALGIVVAHSGPCLGLLFDDSSRHREAMDAATKALDHLGLGVTRLTTLDPDRAPEDSLGPLPMTSSRGPSVASVESSLVTP